MRMTPITIPLANGRSAIIRTAEAKDAAALRLHLVSAAEQTPYLLQTSDEYDAYSRRELANTLRRRQKSAGTLSLCVTVGGTFVAYATVSPYGQLFRTNHRGTMSISVDRAYWGLGIGKALMAEITSFAAFAGYTQLELSVDAENKRAIGLYEHFGFVRCGCIPAALKQADGTFHDELLMIKTLI